MTTIDAPRLGPIHQIAMRADDLDRAVEFYRDTLGARFIARFDPPGMAFFDLGGTRLLLEPNATSATLYFRVSDIRSSHRALQDRGVTFEDEPHLVYRDDAGQFGPAGEEEWMTFFKDPTGNLLALAARLPRATTS
jgi:methylmalonyl-CoA/ethylmalonyl-CoA epimerase